MRKRPKSPVLPDETSPTVNMRVRLMLERHFPAAAASQGRERHLFRIVDRPDTPARPERSIAKRIYADSGAAPC